MTNDLTPGKLNSATFRTVRKGYDPAEVDAVLRDAAAALEHAQQHAAAMEARARAAVARLHERPEGAEPAPPAEPAAGSPLSSEDADRISRTLLLAQETADRAIADANEAAERILEQARVDAESTVESARSESVAIVDEARSEARRLSETERVAAVDEVERLKARREFLLGDVDQLESFLVDQRERLRTAARELESLAERVPGGLGAMTPPPMSASDDETVGESDDAVPVDRGAVADDGDTTDDAPEDAGDPAGDADAGPELEPESEPDDEARSDHEAVSEVGAVSSGPSHAPFPGLASHQPDEPDVVLPPETRMPFADASELAEALGGTNVLDDTAGAAAGTPDVFDTSELDVTQVMEALDRRVRGESLPHRDDVTGELPFRNPPSD